MIVNTYEHGIIVEGITDFHVDHIFDCGQCFRWEKNEDGSYSGIAGGKIVTVSCDCDSGILKIENATEEEFHGFWKHYLDLERDYGVIKAQLAAEDPVMEQAIATGSGIRILNQEPWETLISFIISQNNNIPRIKKCIESLAKQLGEPAGEYRGKIWYSLPSPEVLADATLEDLAPCRLGYRAKYLLETARQVAEEGIGQLESLADPRKTAAEVLEKLRSYCGVGPKVASCIALFSMGRIDSFPIDTWVKKVMHQKYGFQERDIRGMEAYAAQNFGEYGGIAQQYLFYEITHKKPVDK